MSAQPTVPSPPNRGEWVRVRGYELAPVGATYMSQYMLSVAPAGALDSINNLLPGARAPGYNNVAPDGAEKQVREL